ncbi:kinesin-domain-containing protein [Coemansia reversa NRRL 1564]|uniref:Kinesin-like protein n=1 Tax=Coemansia reversa (strain ATCC 12441 / NRRL 1564) TaxID=763665 RepID=A0A2G5BHQ8_COERN|nr:kinesin-domain-containing protein [Coemansia reversa NRRL 1564]|eukprot:PIA18525.1 kinesin-domain-containing protein [Coemansia reversa NRRL 1564]
MTEHKNVVVAVRCRPLNAREEKRGVQRLVTMHGQQAQLIQPGEGTGKRGERRQRTYTFDYAYPPVSDSGEAGQQNVFNDIGQAVLGHALSGYHCCVFAYGQTGSGKSYTMMGNSSSSSDAGLIPRISKGLFACIEEEEEREEGVSYHVEVSYLEIYNERVRDLLNPISASSSINSNGNNNNMGLRVREHPSLGPYVEDLTKAAVSTHSEMLTHMVQGNRARTVAATQMNAASSRSHAVFTAIVTRRKQTEAQVTERVSRISLVDLAGSERAGATMATGARLREGARINQSLAALGKVISALADQERRPPAPSSSSQASSVPFVPYRDSVLTWLLKDSLGGNSRTFMIATVSPLDYGETLSTLRYASRARHIVNVATVNEDATAKLVRQLREEINELQRQLHKRTAPSATTSNNANGGGVGSGGDLEDQLAADEKLIAELNQSWEEKLQRTQALQQAQEQALAAMGISVDTDGQGQGVGLHAPRDIPHLVNLSEDPLMSECLVYNLKPGTTVVGDDDSADIRLGGGVAQNHCVFEYDGELIVRPIANSPVMVNGRSITGPKRLRSGYRIVIGAYVFRLNHPLQAREDLLRAEQFGGISSGGSTSRSTTPSDSRPEDWQCYDRAQQQQLALEECDGGHVVRQLQF